ncbi:hypothetical protein D3C83_149440 [compost metagenome]
MFLLIQGLHFQLLVEHYQRLDILAAPQRGANHTIQAFVGGLGLGQVVVDVVVVENFFLGCGTRLSRAQHDA